MQNSFSYLKEIILDSPDFKFEGKIISHDTFTQILCQIEEITAKVSDNKKFNRITYNILVDLMHGMTGRIYWSDFSNLYIKIQSGKFYILTESTIPNENKRKLAETLDKLNNMLDENDTLKNYYRDLLSNGTFTDKGSGEIGLIDIIRRSNNILLYDFTEIDETNSKVSLIATIEIK